MSRVSTLDLLVNLHSRAYFHVLRKLEALLFICLLGRLYFLSSGAFLFCFHIAMLPFFVWITALAPSQSGGFLCRS